MTLALVPLTRDDANAFVEKHHRHCRRVASHRGAIGAELDGQLVGVAIIANPNARQLASRDRFLCEIVRLCVSPDAPRNTASWLYARARRAAGALGFRRVTTVNLDEESGASLRAAGFTFEREMAARPGWDRPSRPRGELSSDAHRKRRWVAACAVVAVLLAVASGCSQPARITPAYERVIDPAWRDVAASWITITAEAANPKSDEEPEDMLRQLEWTAEWLFGRATLGAYVQPGSAAGETNRRAVFVTYNEAGDNVRRVIDAWVGAR